MYQSISVTGSLDQPCSRNSLGAASGKSRTSTSRLSSGASPSLRFLAGRYILRIVRPKRRRRTGGQRCRKGPVQAARFESSLQSAPRTPTAAPAASQPAPEHFQPGAATGQPFARYGAHDLRADERSNQHFGSRDAATVYARSLGVPRATSRWRCTSTISISSAA
jgi:hypothetical protein